MKDEVAEKPIEDQAPSIDLEVLKEKPKPAKVKKEKKAVIRRRKKPLRKELFEDPDVRNVSAKQLVNLNRYFFSLTMRSRH